MDVIYSADNNVEQMLTTNRFKCIDTTQIILNELILFIDDDPLLMIVVARELQSTFGVICNGVDCIQVTD
ncbi:hypothetical protein BLOT_013448 [Blomia tropicalis]|nr:hypothetical protein BLOT_013448 [Blomia tropicalis]